MYRPQHSTFIAFLLLLTALICSAQNYTINTIAGQGLTLGDGGPAANARFGTISAVAVAHDGTLYIADSAFHQIRKVAKDGTISLFAGSAVRGFGGDNGPAIGAMLDTPTALAVDSGGSVYIGDSGNHRVRVVGIYGNIRTIAGNGQVAPSPAASPVLPGEGGPATAAPLNRISGIGFATNGDILITDNGNNRVFRISQAGNITTVAGNATAPASLADQPAAAATLNGPNGIVSDYLNNIYFAEQKTGVVRRVDASGVLTRLIGTGTLSDTPIASGSPLGYPLSQPVGLSTDGNLNLYIVETGRVSLYTPPNYGTGAIARIQSVVGNTSPITTAMNPQSVAIDLQGNIYVADSTTSLDFRNRVRLISDNKVTTFAGGSVPSGKGDKGPATAAELYFPRALAVDAAQGNVYIADTANSRVRVATPDGKIDAVAAGAGLGAPVGIAVDSASNVYVADGKVIRKIAGGSTTDTGASGSGSLAVDAQGNVYVDQAALVSQLSAATQTLTTIAGTGTAGFSGDNGPANAAQIDTTAGVAVDASGSLYIADGANGRIRKVDSTGAITTIAGGGTSLADGAAATDAALNMPLGLAVDGAGNIFIAEYGGNRVRLINAAGTIRTIAGNGLQGFSGDGGSATNAALNGPTDVKVDGQGNVYIADSWNSSIRKLTPAATLPTPSISKISNAGSFATGPVAPGERVILTGTVLGPNSKVQFDGTAAPVLSSTFTSTLVVVPYELAGRTTSQVTVTTGGATSAPFSVQVAPSAPGIYTMTADGTGQAVAFGTNGALNGVENPEAAGNVVSVICTGAGVLNPAVATGVPISSNTPSPALPVRAMLNGLPASVDQAYSIAGTMGQFIVDVRIPADTSSNSFASLQIMVGTAVSQQVDVAVKNSTDGDGGGDGGGDSGGGTDPGMIPQLRKQATPKHLSRPLPPVR